MFSILHNILLSFLHNSRTRYSLPGLELLSWLPLLGAAKIGVGMVNGMVNGIENGIENGNLILKKCKNFTGKSVARIFRFPWYDLIHSYTQELKSDTL